MDRKNNYSTRQITWALENYLTLAEGNLPTDGLSEPDYGCRIQKSRNLNAPFVRPTQLKADIDRALQSLKPTQKAIVITMSIAGFSYTEVGYWWGLNYLEVEAIRNYSIRKMKRFLNENTKSDYRAN
jgi:DNA-directed RNA polymerase specialized sigma24 family protein